MIAVAIGLKSERGPLSGEAELRTTCQVSYKEC